MKPSEMRRRCLLAAGVLGLSFSAAAAVPPARPGTIVHAAPSLAKAALSASPAWSEDAPLVLFPGRLASPPRTAILGAAEAERRYTGAATNAAGAVFAVATNAVFPGTTLVPLYAPTSAWTQVDVLAFDLFWPTNGAADAQILVNLMDWDYLWYQTLLAGRPQPGRWNRFYVDFRPGSLAWESRGHHSAWHHRARVKPKEVGIRIFGESSSTNACRLDRVYGFHWADETPPTIRRLRTGPTHVPRYEKFELSFELPDRYADPFSSNEVSVIAEFTNPSGAVTEVEGFYSQDFYREVDPSGEKFHPQGAPYWQVRFAPATTGVHTYRVVVRDRYGEASWGPGRLLATEPESPGFVRVDTNDTRYFRFDNGDPFFAIGHNIRSPYDLRLDENFPWQQRWAEGSLAYRRFLRDMRAHGENTVEIWQASWSLGLEWIEDWPWYHGVGDYNLAHAWELDQILADAHASDIFINLVLHNHGKFSTIIDSEWAYNPFNVKNGGSFAAPLSYITEPEGKAAFIKLMRYIIARWGYSRNILAWELWSELDLTGNAHGDYRKPAVVEWHKEMGRWIHGADPNRHLVGTHVSGDFNNQNKTIISLPEMDFCPVDAYHGNRDPLWIVQLMQHTARFNNKYDKPVLVTEFGGSAYASGLKHLEDTLHAALWASPAVPLAGTPMFWWWGLIEEENFYPKFRALSAFMAGEDRGGKSMQMRAPGLVYREGKADKGGLLAVGMQDERRLLGWVTKKHNFSNLDPDGPRKLANLQLAFSDLAEGHLRVEFWDTIEGAPIATESGAIMEGRAVIDVPAFARDIAYKGRVVAEAMDPDDG